MRIIVTGASGFIGHNVLLGAPREWEILALYHQTPGLDDFIARAGLSHVRAMRCDLLDAGAVKSVAREVGGRADAVLYLAANADLASGLFEGFPLAAGEALWLVNNNAFATGFAALAIADSGRLLDSLHVAGALELEAFRANPVKVWRFLIEMADLLAGARPNPAHAALADLERAGAVSGIATQNIDGLHQAAGSRGVIELHGGHGRLRCIKCGRARPADDIARLKASVAAEGAPRCGVCGGHLKPDVTLFGEMLPDGAYEAAERLARSAGTMLVIGTSATRMPARTAR